MEAENKNQPKKMDMKSGPIGATKTKEGVKQAEEESRDAKPY